MPRFTVHGCAQRHNRAAHSSFQQAAAPEDMHPVSCSPSVTCFHKSEAALRRV